MPPSTRRILTVRDHQHDPNKQKSRITIWRELQAFRAPGRSRALIFPGSHRYEWELMRSLGYTPEQTYFVERNAAVLAHLTRRSKGQPTPPKENIMRMMLSEAALVLQKRAIRLDVAHLDFCSNCEGERQMINEIRAFFRANIIADEALVAITWLMGREHKIEEIGKSGLTFGVVEGRWDEYAKLSAYDRGRIRKVWEAVEADVTLQSSGNYQNVTTNNPMRWVILRVKTHPRLRTTQQE